MQLHLKGNECKESITGPLSCNDFHGLGSALELLVESLDDVAGPKGDPFLFREVEKSEACIQGFLQALYCGEELVFPFPLELAEEFHGFLLGGSIEN